MPNAVELNWGGGNRDRGAHTRRKGLLKLLGLVVVLEHQGVEVLLASDLELDVVGLLVLLDPRGCKESELVIQVPYFLHLVASFSNIVEIIFLLRGGLSAGCIENTYTKRPCDGRSR